MKIKEIQRSAEFDKNKSDWRIPSSALRSGNGHVVWDQPQLSFTSTLEVLDGKARLAYDPWSFGQLCQRLGIPVAYARSCPNFLQDENINYWLGMQEREFLLRADGSRLRAVLTDRYVPIANTEVLKSIEAVIDVQPKYTCYITPDYVYVKIFAMETPTGMYGMGVVVINGEIGDHALRVAPFVQRTSCRNSIVFLDGGFYARHITTYSQGYLRATIKEKVAQCLGVSGQFLERVIAADVEEIPNISQVIDNICAMKGYNSEVKHQIIVGTEGHSTKGAVAQGLSYAAHEVDDQRVSMDLEAAAGYYLMGTLEIAAVVDSELSS